MNAVCLRTRARRRALLLAGAALAFAGSAQAQWWSYLRAPSTMAEVTELLETRFPDVPLITTAALAEELARGPAPLLLDVREKAEFDVSHLPGARHAPDAATALRIASSLPPGARIVTYCSIGYRSAAVARALAEGGHPNTVNLDGSIFRWANEGRPIVRDASPAGATAQASTVHPYDATWGKLLEPSRRAPISSAGSR
ncbi:MAG: rhodanese-like domain-containing protein [Lautropia sp.]